MSVSTHEKARAARADGVERRRLDEARCAWEFVYRGEPHEDCVFEARGEPRCSRDYDPGPPPTDEKLYEGSALLSLWEDTPWSYEMAGWNIKRRNA